MAPLAARLGSVTSSTRFTPSAAISEPTSAVAPKPYLIEDVSIVKMLSVSMVSPSANGGEIVRGGPGRGIRTRTRVGRFGGCHPTLPLLELDLIARRRNRRGRLDGATRA